MAKEESGMQDSVKGLITLGIGVFMLILFLNLSYQEFATSTNTLAIQFALFSSSNSTSPASVSAPDISEANTLSAACFGQCSWISATNPLTIYITGNAVTNYGTNVISANSASSQTLIYQVTSSTFPATLTSSGGNFFNIQTIKLGGVPANAAPSLNVQVTESYRGNVLNSAPDSYIANSISANGIATVSLGTNYGVVGNFSKYAGGVTNAYGSNLSLAVTALVLIAIVIAILYGIRDTGLIGGFVG